MKVKQIGNILCDIRIFFYSCLWLMILLTVGTIAQKDIGLFRAQEIFFSSYVIWLGPIPLPGGYIVMGLIFISLAAKLIFKSPLRKDRLGIIVTHFGSLLLLLGGFLTGAFSDEGNMVIPEGQTVGYYSSYHKLELAVIDTSPKNHDTVYAFRDGWIKKGALLKNKMPFEIKITDYCRNCYISRRMPEENIEEKMQGFGKKVKIREISLAKEDAENRAGISFEILENGKIKSLHTIIESMPVDEMIEIAGKKFVLKLRHKQTRLPFEIELLDFKKDVYAQTAMARAYSSTVNLMDGDLKQRSLIEMNAPLRYKGYTLYQSSYIEGGTETTVLSVVKNIGRLFPYISSIIICIGLLLHLIIKSPALFSGRGENV